MFKRLSLSAVCAEHDFVCLRHADTADGKFRSRRFQACLRYSLCAALLLVASALAIPGVQAQTQTAHYAPSVTPVKNKIEKNTAKSATKNSDKSVQATAPAEPEEVAIPLPSVVSGGSDHCIKRWDAAGRMSATLGAQDSSITVIAMLFIMDKNRKPVPLLISGGKSGLLKIWGASEDEAANAMPLRSVKAHEGGVTALAVSPNGLLIATGGADAYIRLWDRGTEQMLVEMKAHDAAVQSLRFTPDSKTLVSGGADRLIRIWKVGDGAQTLDYQSTILAHDAGITAIALSPDGLTVASVSADGYLKVWQIMGGSLQKHIRVTGRGVLAVAFSPDGKTIATGDEDGKVRLWNVKTGLAMPFVGSHERGVYALAWTPDGEMLVSGGGDKTLRYWNVASGRQIARIAAHDGTVQTIAIVP